MENPDECGSEIKEAHWDCQEEHGKGVPRGNKNGSEHSDAKNYVSPWP